MAGSDASFQSRQLGRSRLSRMTLTTLHRTSPAFPPLLPRLPARLLSSVASCHATRSTVLLSRYADRYHMHHRTLLTISSSRRRSKPLLASSIATWTLSTFVRAARQSTMPSRVTAAPSGAVASCPSSRSPAISPRRGGTTSSTRDSINAADRLSRAVPCSGRARRGRRVCACPSCATSSTVRPDYFQVSLTFLNN